MDSSFWSAVPEILWFLLAVTIFIALQRELRSLIRHVAVRIRSGASIEIGSFKLGSVKTVASMSTAPSPSAELIGLEEGPLPSGVFPEDLELANERARYYAQTRNVMLVHKLFKPTKQGQLYDVLLYVVPHYESTLLEVIRVDYFLGRYWNNSIFSSSERSLSFAIRTSAYGTFLCAAKVVFNDEASTVVHRYIDFEMGDLIVEQLTPASTGQPASPSAR